MTEARRHVKRIFWLGMTGAFLLGALYIGCYLFPPRLQPAAGVVMNVIYLLTFVFAAGTATAVLRRYKEDERPYRVWLFFALGLWTWFIGELVWGIYELTRPLVPDVTVADLFWVSAYGLFSLALYYQYRLIRPAGKMRAVMVMLGAWSLIIFISHLGAYIINGSSLRYGFFEHYLFFYYVTCDLGITITSLIFVRAFGTGILMRPWLGLLFMLLADTFYTWLHDFGLYTYTASGGNLLSLFADVFYLGAFLAIAMGCLAQYLIMKYGPGASPFRAVTLLFIRRRLQRFRKAEPR